MPAAITVYDRRAPAGLPLRRERNHSRPRGEPSVSLSQLLTRLANDASRERVSIADLMSAIGDRALGVLIFVFAVPNAVPLPPGASTVLGSPLLFLTAQLALGKRAWLPSFIARRTIDRAHLSAVVQRTVPLLAEAEALLRPRLPALLRPPFENLIGIVCFVLSVILFLPIPMGNMPPAIAICIFALAILERDGLWALFGILASIAAIALVSGVLFALFESGAALFTNFFA